tara:strand:+ start:1469 stop:1708 length:240 start_codon:yes stop_codon:yes gene_type:complete
MKIKTDAIMQKTMNKYGFDESTPVKELPNIITCELALSAYLFRLHRKEKDRYYERHGTGRGSGGVLSEFLEGRKKLPKI